MGTKKWVIGLSNVCNFFKNWNKIIFHHEMVKRPNACNDECSHLFFEHVHYQKLLFRLHFKIIFVYIFSLVTNKTVLWGPKRYFFMRTIFKIIISLFIRGLIFFLSIVSEILVNVPVFVSTWWKLIFLWKNMNIINNCEDVRCWF